MHSNPILGTQESLIYEQYSRALKAKVWLWKGLQITLLSCVLRRWLRCRFARKPAICASAQKDEGSRTRSIEV